MLYGGDSFEYWDTPLSGRNYSWFVVNKGEWVKDTFTFRIAASPAEIHWDWWACSISNIIWLRFTCDELFDQVLQRPDLAQPKKKDGPYSPPFFRILNSRYAPLYEKHLKEMTQHRQDDRVTEYLIWNLESEIHFLTTQEPSFQRVAS